MYSDEKMTSGEIAKIYDCCSGTIIRHLKEWNISIRNSASGEQYNNKYKANIHYFDHIDSAEKAYWLGYIAADGHVVDDTALMLGCQHRDVDILDKFKKCVESNHPIKINKDGNTIFNITSKHMASTLNKYGMMHDKSHSMHLKEVIKCIPEVFHNSFYTGLFDGDGSIKYYNYEYVKGFQYHFGFTGLKESVELFAERFHLKTKLIDESNGIMTVRTANAPQIYWCIHELYDNSPLYCNRKYNTAHDILRLIDKEKKNVVRGITFDIVSGKWLAKIGKNKKNIRIGLFKTKEEAEYQRLKYEYEQYGYDAPQWFFFNKYGICE